MNILRSSLILVCLLSLCSSCSSTHHQYLTEAKKAANWLSQQKVQSNAQGIWVDEIGSEEVSLTLSNGVPSKVLFYLDLYLATKDEQYLQEATQGCEYIVDQLPENLEEAKAIRNSASLYGPIAGSAFVLTEAYQITGEQRWKTSVDHCVTLLDSLSIQPDGRYWNHFNDVLIGSAGTGLFLLYQYDTFQEPKTLQIAKEAAEELEQRAVRAPDTLYWSINQETDMNLPNFSHGAAGIGYFFARLYEATDDTHYLEIARQVADYLELIAWKPDGAFLLPYGFPDYGWEREYDIGWAHGPAGTARLFYKLWQITKDEKWLELVRQCSNGIKKSGLPGLPNEPFGTTEFPVDMRFGLGSVIDFYIGLAQQGLLPPNDRYLATLLEALDEKSITDDQKKYWQIKRYGFMGGEEGAPATFTGYFYGTSGLARLYVKLHNLTKDSPTGISLPDNPFKSGPTPP